MTSQRAWAMAAWVIGLTATAHGQSAPSSSKTTDGGPNLTAGDSTFDSTVNPEIEVKRSKTGQLLVKPVVNGVAAGWFIYDTGAGICVVSTPHIDKFSLRTDGSIEASGVGGSSHVPLLRANKLVLGPLTLRDQPFISTDLSFLKQHMEDEIVGVLGFGVLSACVVEMDLTKPRIVLHDEKGYTLPSGEWTAVSLAERVPIVTARFEGREGRFMLDTGSNDVVSFAEPAVRRLKLLDGRELRDAKLGGVGGFISARRGRLTSLDLGGIHRENVDATFATEARRNAAGNDRDGTIGAGFLSDVTLVLDYSKHRIGLIPRKN